MITFRLWNALHRPYVSHPLYRRLNDLDESAHQRFRLRDILPEDSAWGSIFLILSIIAIALGGWRVLVILMLLIPLIFVSIGTICGALVLLRTSTLIARQTEQGKQVLMGVTPLGLPGMMWALCSVAYTKNRVATALKEAVNGIYFVGFVMMAIPTFFAVMFALVEVILGTDGTNLAHTPFGLWGLVVLYAGLGAIYLDLVQSIALGSVIGMLIPTYTRTRLDSNGLAIGTYLAVQFISYAIIAFFDLFLLPNVAAQFAIVDSTLLALSQFVAFFAVRDFALRGIWHLLMHRLETTPSEFRQMTGI